MTDIPVLKHIADNAKALFYFIICVLFGGLPVLIFALFYPYPTTIPEYITWLQWLLVSAFATAIWFFVIAMPILDKTAIKRIIDMQMQE